MNQRLDARATLAALVGGLLLAGTAHAQVQVIGPEPVTVDETRLPERHQVAKDETLSSLAERFLGNGDAWPKLWSYNPEVTNPHWIYPGLVLRLKPGATLDGPQQAVAAPNAGTPGASTLRTLQIATRRSSSAGAGAVLIGEQVYLDGEALAHAGKVVAAPEDHFMLSPTDEVYLKFKDIEPKPGLELTLFVRQPKRTVSPPPNEIGPAPRETGQGEVVRVMGALRITHYDADRKVAKAVITEALEPIERGFEVTDVPYRLRLVPPKKNGKGLAAHIVSSSRGLGQLGKEQVVFIDAGAKHGVEVGNRFWVIRQGDSWRKTLKLKEARSGALVPDEHPIANDDLPPEVVGELHVLYVRPDTSTAVISSSLLELNPGDRVEMKAGY
jgi:LysM domain